MKSGVISRLESESGVSGSLILFLILILLVYSNTFHATWHLDDVTNILDNKNIQVTSLSIKDWSRSMYSPFLDPSSPKPDLYRPVAMLTFAVNWFVGGAEVFGYHLVNIGIHCMNASLLFFTILNLLRTPNMKDRYQGSEHFIALLAAAFWALHPIQTQAVTYIVQRMASMAVLFYIAGIFLYVKGRTTQTLGKRSLLFGLCSFSFFLAMGSKQNAVTLPGALLLIEIIFFTNPGFWKRKKIKWVCVAAATGFTIISVFLVYYWQKNPVSFIADGYKLRSFTLIERLLTEFRIVIFYLNQLFYPVPGQFSIIHDFDVSRSLLNPWTTLAAIITICALLIAAFYNAFKKPLLSFSIFFFFVGHSIESTIFPLELVFEHRNYLPSLFLFLPVASGISCLIDTYRIKNKTLYFLLLCFVPVLIVGLALGSYTRNFTWNTEKTLWRDAIQKAPSQARPYQGLARAYEKENRLDDALKLYETALTLKDPEPKLSRFISLSNMGNIYKKRKAYDEAVRFLTMAVNVETGVYADRVRYNLVLCLLNSHKEQEALTHLATLLARQQNNGRFMATMGFILLKQEKTDLALHHLRDALKHTPHDKDILLVFAMALSAKNEYERADWYLRLARKSYTRNLVIYLGLLQNAIKMQDVDRINTYLLQINSLFRFDEIKHFFTEHAKGYNYIGNTLVPIEDSIILPYLVDFVKEKARRLGNGAIE